MAETLGDGGYVGVAVTLGDDWAVVASVLLEAGACTHSVRTAAVRRLGRHRHPLNAATAVARQITQSVLLSTPAAERSSSTTATPHYHQNQTQPAGYQTLVGQGLWVVGWLLV